MSKGRVLNLYPWSRSLPAHGSYSRDPSSQPDGFDTFPTVAGSSGSAVSSRRRIPQSKICSEYQNVNGLRRKWGLLRPNRSMPRPAGHAMLGRLARGPFLKIPRG